MRFTFALIAVLMMGVVGCNKKSSSSIPSNSNVTEVTPPPTYYQPAPQPYQPQPVQPVVYDSAPPAMQANTPAPVAAGGSYTIKKGDTLYSIAKSRYGNGNQYTKIVSANPGLDPTKLRVGQTITIPS